MGLSEHIAILGGNAVSLEVIFVPFHGCLVVAELRWCGQISLVLHVRGTSTLEAPAFFHLWMIFIASPKHFLHEGC